MNKPRREQIENAKQLLQQAQSILSQVAEEERAYFDNMPESFQNGEKGEKADAAATALESASSCTDEAVDALDELEE